MTIPRAESFREWLRDRLRHTPWATIAIADERIEAVAEQLGLAPDLLVEVRAEAKLEKHARGLPPARRLYQFHLFLPAVIHRAWRDECKFRGIESGTLLRSLISDYLLGSREPMPLRHWMYQGRTYRMGDAQKRAQGLLRATIPQGARRALVYRASVVGAKPTSVARALVLEALQGLHRGIALIEAQSMYDDERRYLGGPDEGILTRDRATG